MKKKYISLIIVFISILLIDQLSKVLVINNFELGESITLIKGFLNFTYYINTGAAFGMFGGSVIILALVALMFLSYLVLELKKNIEEYPMNIFLTFIISGLIGNLIDRIFRGYVVDFISFNIFNPIFNVSDIFITIGCMLTIVLLIKEGANGHKNK